MKASFSVTNSLIYVKKKEGRRAREEEAEGRSGNLSKRFRCSVRHQLSVACRRSIVDPSALHQVGYSTLPTRVTHTLFALCVLHLTFLSVILSALAARRGRRRPPRDRTEACLPCGGCSRGQHCVRPSWPRRFPDHRHRRRSLPLLLQRTHCRNCGGILNWMRHTCTAWTWDAWSLLKKQNGGTPAVATWVGNKVLPFGRIARRREYLLRRTRWWKWCTAPGPTKRQCGSSPARQRYVV